MRRKVFDLLASFGGIVLVVVLVIAGGLLVWGHSFTSSNVHTQLSEQQVQFSPKAAFAHAKPEYSRSSSGWPASQANVGSRAQDSPDPATGPLPARSPDGTKSPLARPSASPPAGAARRRRPDAPVRSHAPPHRHTASE